MMGCHPPYSRKGGRKRGAPPFLLRTDMSWRLGLWLAFVCLLFAPEVLAEPEPITLCILDSGSNLPGAEGWNYVGDTADLTDADGHGTRIHSLFEQCAPGARLVVLKCFEGGESVDEDAILKALRAAVDKHQADIISMSWTLNEPSADLEEAIRYASEGGAILLASAGNLSLATPIGSDIYPALYDSVIGVSGVNIDEEGEVRSSLWYLAGEMVYVCARADFEGEKGSSYAVPRVAAKVAEYLAQEDDQTDEQVRRFLRDLAEDQGEEGYDPVYGWGYVADGLDRIAE